MTPRQRISLWLLNLLRAESTDKQSRPAIWMGESGQVVIVPGTGDVKPLFTQRAHAFEKQDEVSTPYVYEVSLNAASIESGYNATESVFSPVPGGEQPIPSLVREGANNRIRRHIRDQTTAWSDRDHEHDALKGGTSLIHVAMTASSHVGRLKLKFGDGYRSVVGQDAAAPRPYVFIQATRENWTGQVEINEASREIYGSNPQRQDYALGPLRAPKFSGYFVSRFSEPFASFGVTHGGYKTVGARNGTGEHLGAYVTFEDRTSSVEVRTGVSFVSIEQARRNLDIESPDGSTFEDSVSTLKQAWLEKIGRVTIEGVNKTTANHDPRTIFYTGLYHALQYPADFSEPLGNGSWAYYSGYTDNVHVSNDSYYQSWSIWDTYRAEHSLLTIFAPERVDSMMRSLLTIFDWSGRLPMWANLIETNIMIGTHVDCVLANALTRGFKAFNVTKAWAGVKKNAFEPPVNDTDLLYYDREGYTPDEVRAGLTAYMPNGYVPNDQWAESASRTLDYAFDDHAAAVVAEYAGDEEAAPLLRRRSQNYRTLYNANTTFMEAKDTNGTWAGSEQGWTEGDDWVYTFNVMHDPEGLANLMGGREHLKAKLDAHFDGGHNDHSNEPSHHVPYMYAALGFPAYTQNLTRAIAAGNYNATSGGLSGNEDLGQMSAWYICSALGFYPLNPASDEYVVGAPFFEKVTIRLPSSPAAGGYEEHELVIEAPNAPRWPFVRSLTIDGVSITKPVITHSQIISAEKIVFEMADVPQAWGAEPAQA
nr:putative glycosidase [Quercus suber]